MSEAANVMSNTTLKELINLKIESEDLDYKTTVHLDSAKSVLDICVDVMAMANTLGGYLVFGVNDSFEPIGLPETLHIDPAQIQQILSNYMRPPPKIFYVEKDFEISKNEKKFAFLRVEQSKEIVVTSKDGVYQDKEKSGKSVCVFRTGEVFVRRSASSRRADSDAMRLLIDRIAEARKVPLTGRTNLRREDLNELRIRQMHNLQRPDYRQFIGREGYIEDIIAKLSQRFFVVSIDGIGGVGKTALASEIAHRCVEGRLFDAVVWISAKKKRLVLTGIDDIVPSLTTYENLVNAILEVLGYATSTGMHLEEKEKEVKGLLSTAKCLIVVDNLEAVEDERIFDFLKNLPEPSKALITSRKRLGEVERIVRLKEMSFDETKRLILLDALDKSVEQLLRADDKVFSEIYNVTGGIPLAIRWVVGWTSMGRDISTVCAKVRKSGSPVLEFCFQEIYDTLLKTEARTVLDIMPIFDHNPTKEEVAAALKLSEDKLDDFLTQLVTLSLLNQEIGTDDQGRIKTAYSILPLTLSFAQSKLSENRGLEVAARKNLGFFLQRQQKENEALEQYGYALEKIGATTEKGKLAALQAQLAFAAYQRGNHDEATRLFKQAVEADPNLAYTYQLWAMVERQEGNVGKADELFREAARLNPTNPIIWRSWAMMKKELNDLGGSEKILREGLRNRPNDKATVHSLAVVASLKGEYDVADKLFEDAYTRNPSSFEEKKNNLYVFAARAENFRKWGEDEEKKRLPESARDKCKKGLAQISEGLRFDPTDWNFIKNSIRLHASLARIESKLGNLDEAESLFGSAIYFSPRNWQQRRHNSTVYLSRALNFVKMGKKEDAKKMCEESIRQAYNIRAANLLAELDGDFDRDNKEI